MPSTGTTELDHLHGAHNSPVLFNVNGDCVASTKEPKQCGWVLGIGTFLLSSSDPSLHSSLILLHSLRGVVVVREV